MILSFLSAKGGQGRSTLCVRLASWLAVAGHRSLVVDLSPCGTASQLLGHGPSPDPGAGAVLAGDAKLSSAQRETAHPKLWLLRRDGLGAASVDPTNATRTLRGLARSFDFVLLDPATGLSGWNHVAFSASDRILVPVTPDDASFAGLDLTLGWLDRTRPALRHRPRLGGIVVNEYEERVAGCKSRVAKLKKDHRGDLLKVHVRRDARLRSMDSAASLFNKPKQPKGADEDLVALRRELLKRFIQTS